MISCDASIATNRSHSLFNADIIAHYGELQAALQGRRVCVIGGAGSIGQATLRELSKFPVDELTIIDQDENGLANLSRQFQSASSPPLPKTINTLPLDFGSQIALRYFSDHAGFDYVLNFAALKHVRTEKDAFCAMALIETNVLKHKRLLDALNAKHPSTNYFSVSTDKAANPVSFMGATKRLMEHVMFCEGNKDDPGKRVSARFANVAFSNGSLLQSFAQRLEQGVPLATPLGIKRYFISLQEAGELCLLAAILGEDNSIYVPQLSPAEHLIEMRDVAIGFLETNKLKPVEYSLSEEAAAKTDCAKLKRKGAYPLVLTPADTAGEKPYEEFISEYEEPQNTNFSALDRIAYRANSSAAQLDAQLDRFDALSQGHIGTPLTLDLLKQEIAKLEPRFAEAHLASAKRLDDRI